MRELIEHLATKADLSDMKADLIKWMVGVMLGGMASGSYSYSGADQVAGGLGDSA